MQTQVEKTPQTSSRTVANEPVSQKNGTDQSAPFTDRRPEAIAQRKLREAADGSPQVQRLQLVQAMANNRPGVGTMAKPAVNSIVIQPHGPIQLSHIADSKSQPIQRWAVPAEDAEANRQKDHLDGIERAAGVQRDRARDLAAPISPSLKVLWAVPQLTAYDTANTLRINTAAANQAAQPATRNLVDIKTDVRTLGQRLTQLKAQLDTFEAGFTPFTVRINQQVQRHGNLSDILAQPNGAAKLAQGQNLATSIQTMNLVNVGAELTNFEANISAATFSEGEVAAARLLGEGPVKNAVVQFLTELFATGQLKLDTWASSYPTNFDLKTGEFGAEWYLKCSTQRWIGQKWVFHAHCETIRDEHGHHAGFRFKNILGTNHLKMTTERMAAGVQLDLPLSADTLAAMAAPYQDEFHRRLSDDSVFRETLKKGK